MAQGPGSQGGGFVEVLRGAAEAGVGCVIDLEKGNGTRMRI
jgi:hypothetical protein